MDAVILLLFILGDSIPTSTSSLPPLLLLAKLRNRCNAELFDNFTLLIPETNDVVDIICTGKISWCLYICQSRFLQLMSNGPLGTLDTWDEYWIVKSIRLKITTTKQRICILIEASHAMKETRVPFLLWGSFKNESAPTVLTVHQRTELNALSWLFSELLRNYTTDIYSGFCVIIFIIIKYYIASSLASCTYRDFYSYILFNNKCKNMPTFIFFSGDIHIGYWICKTKRKQTTV